MRQSRGSINSQLKETKKHHEDKRESLSFQRIIAKQYEVIQSLSSQLLLLKSYISLERANQPQQVNCSDISVNNTSTSSSESHIRNQLEESMNASHKKYQSFLKRLALLLEINSKSTVDEELLIQKVVHLKNTIIKSQDPVFVERIKEIKVPIVVEKIVQKIVEKIVYVERQPQVVEKFIERPVFKEKLLEKCVDRREEREENRGNLNKSYSQKNFKQKREEERQYDNRYDSKYDDKNKYDSYRKGDSGQNLVKKRGVDYGKPFYRKNY